MEWISVNDVSRRPTPKQKCLVFSRDGDATFTTTAIYRPQSGTGFDWGHVGFGWFRKVTHWQPLPEPPKE